MCLSVCVCVWGVRVCGMRVCVHACVCVCVCVQYYTAEYPFQARSSNEVSLQPGQVVIVLSHQDLDGNSEWWMVDADGYQGYAPANYLRKM